jgi:hypothetical protein
MPVLDALVSYLDEDPGAGFVSVEQLAELSGVPVDVVGRAAIAMDGVYLTVQKLMSGGNMGPWIVSNIRPAARLAVGQWPTGESLVTTLVQGLEEAAESEPDAARKGRLRSAAGMLSGTVRDVAVEVAARAVSRQMGMG